MRIKHYRIHFTGLLQVRLFSNDNPLSSFRRFGGNTLRQSSRQLN